MLLTILALPSCIFCQDRVGDSLLAENARIEREIVAVDSMLQDLSHELWVKARLSEILHPDSANYFDSLSIRFSPVRREQNDLPIKE